VAGAERKSEPDTEPNARGKKLTTISRDQLRSFLKQPTTAEHIRRVVLARVSKKAPKEAVDDMIQEASIAVMTAKWGPRSPGTAKGWVATVTVRAMVNYLLHGGRDPRWLQRDGSDEKTDPAYTLSALEVPSESWLVSRWLAHAVEGSERDQETLEILAYRVRTGKYDEEVAAEHGMNEASLRSRVQRYKRKYEPLRKRRRATVVMAAVALVAGVALAALIASLAGHASAASVTAPCATPSAPLAPSPATAEPPSVEGLVPSATPEDRPAHDASLKKRGKLPGKGVLKGLTRD
jgi:DNA-directed RNA polymerase specialized sigma24 family protein